MLFPRVFNIRSLDRRDSRLRRLRQSTTETLTLLVNDVNEKPEFTTTTWTITKNDEGGFNIKIKEEDDKKPFLSQTSYVYCATVGSTSGTLGQVTSTDNDVLDAHTTKKYEFVGSGPFYASGTGSLTYGDLSSYAKGTKFETTLRSTETNQSVQPTETNQSVQSTETNQSVQSTETNQSVQSTETNQSVQSTETNQSVQSTETNQSVQSTETN
ncbi:hypothetical protein DPMN_020720 [Dreissena polymorpha]|uniref:Uncharacterized protein n=1 Tax=Dreissena polymorpha TaxID=45954 RepID=A0A9D4NKZ4_DREPO|nr:hypothetical protein DPMN_020720 [Dreissena polymorpha]